MMVPGLLARENQRLPTPPASSQMSSHAHLQNATFTQLINTLASRITAGRKAAARGVAGLAFGAVLACAARPRSHSPCLPAQPRSLLYDTSLHGHNHAYICTHSAMPSSPPSRGKRRRGGFLPPWPPSSHYLLVILLPLLPLQPCARLAKPPTRSIDPYNERVVQALVDYSAAAYYCRTSACEKWLCRYGWSKGGRGQGQGEARHVGVGRLSSFNTCTPEFPNAHAFSFPFPLSVPGQCLLPPPKHSGDACVRQRSQWEWFCGVGPR